MKASLVVMWHDGAGYMGTLEDPAKIAALRALISDSPTEAQAQGGGWCVERGGDPDFPQWAEVKELIVTAPPSAPVVDRAGAVKLAQAAAYASHHTHDYLPHTAEEARNWQPHEWVVDAILAATLDAAPQQASAPVGVEDVVMAARNAENAIRNCAAAGQIGGGYVQYADDLRDAVQRLAQQPAAVDGAMVERAVAAYAAGPWMSFSPEESRETHRDRMRAALQAALAAQPGGSDNDR